MFTFSEEKQNTIRQNTIQPSPPTPVNEVMANFIAKAWECVFSKHPRFVAPPVQRSVCQPVDHVALMHDPSCDFRKFLAHIYCRFSEFPSVAFCATISMLERLAHLSSGTIAPSSVQRHHADIMSNASLTHLTPPSTLVSCVVLNANGALVFDGRYALRFAVTLVTLALKMHSDCTVTYKWILKHLVPPSVTSFPQTSHTWPLDTQSLITLELHVAYALGFHFALYTDELNGTLERNLLPSEVLYVKQVLETC
jgi:hypothetical protein